MHWRGHDPLKESLDFTSSTTPIGGHPKLMPRKYGFVSGDLDLSRNPESRALGCTSKMELTKLRSSFFLGVRSSSGFPPQTDPGSGPGSAAGSCCLGRPPRLRKGTCGYD